MLGLSLPEILFLAVLGLVVIGPKQLPEVARVIARMLNELRRASSSFTEEFRNQVKIDPIRFDDHPAQTPPEVPYIEPIPEPVRDENTGNIIQDAATSDPDADSKAKKS